MYTSIRTAQTAPICSKDYLLDCTHISLEENKEHIHLTRVTYLWGDHAMPNQTIMSRVIPGSLASLYQLGCCWKTAKVMKEDSRFYCWYSCCWVVPWPQVTAFCHISFSRLASPWSPRHPIFQELSSVDWPGSSQHIAGCCFRGSVQLSHIASTVLLLSGGVRLFSSSRI